MLLKSLRRTELLLRIRSKDSKSRLLYRRMAYPRCVQDLGYCAYIWLSDVPYICVLFTC